MRVANSVMLVNALTAAGYSVTRIGGSETLACRSPQGEPFTIADGRVEMVGSYVVERDAQRIAQDITKQYVQYGVRTLAPKYGFQVKQDASTQQFTLTRKAF